eukprot:tig00020539_g10402.t1
MEQLPLHVHELVVSKLGAGDAALLGSASCSMRRLVRENDVYWIKQLERRGIAVPEGLKTGTAHEVFWRTENSLCASCRRPNDGARCPITKRLACDRCREPVALRDAMAFAGLPRSATDALRTLYGLPRMTTRAAAMEMRYQRQEARATPGSEPMRTLARRLGLGRARFGAPGGVRMVGFCPRTLEPLYDTEGARRIAEKRYGADVEGTVRRMREQRARTRAMRLQRITEAFTRLSAAAERYDPPLMVSGYHNTRTTLCVQINPMAAMPVAVTPEITHHFVTPEEISGAENFNAFPGVVESEFHPVFAAFTDAKYAHREYRIARLAAALGAHELVTPTSFFVQHPTGASTPTALDLYLFAGVKARFEEAVQELRARIYPTIDTME